MWMTGVQTIKSTHDGGSMLGGPPRVVWHTYEAPARRQDATTAARYMISSGNEVHFTFNPYDGGLVQILDTRVAGRGLTNKPGKVQTNRCGNTCIQIEVIGYANMPWTNELTAAGRESLHRLMKFIRAHGIPDTWPAGPPPRYPGGKDPRDATIWLEQPGHYGHSQVPENDHGDPGAIDINTITGGDVQLSDVIPLGENSRRVVSSAAGTDVSAMTVGDLLQRAIGLLYAQAYNPPPTVNTDAIMDAVLERLPTAEQIATEFIRQLALR